MVLRRSTSADRPSRHRVVGSPGPPVDLDQVLDRRLSAGRPELPDLALERQVGPSQPFVLAQVFLPGTDVEALDEAVRIADVALERPIRCPVPKPDLTQLAHAGDEGG